jgi:hypothetical protein
LAGDVAAPLVSDALWLNHGPLATDEPVLVAAALHGVLVGDCEATEPAAELAQGLAQGLD